MRHPKGFMTVPDLALKPSQRVPKRTEKHGESDLKYHKWLMAVKPATFQMHASHNQKCFCGLWFRFP